MVCFIRSKFLKKKCSYLSVAKIRKIGIPLHSIPQFKCFVLYFLSSLVSRMGFKFLVMNPYFSFKQAYMYACLATEVWINIS